MDEQNNLTIEDEQKFINSELNKGVFFSIFWLAGIGSFIALRKGIDSIKDIKSSKGKLKGIKRSLWCIIVGSLGLLFWIPIIILLILSI